MVAKVANLHWFKEDTFSKLQNQRCFFNQHNWFSFFFSETPTSHLGQKPNSSTRRVAAKHSYKSLLLWPISSDFFLQKETNSKQEDQRRGNGEGKKNKWSLKSRILRPHFHAHEITLKTNGTWPTQQLLPLTFFKRHHSRRQRWRRTSFCTTLRCSITYVLKFHTHMKLLRAWNVLHKRFMCGRNESCWKKLFYKCNLFKE